MNNRDILGVSPQAGADEIKKAFREAAKEVHPDVSDSSEAAEAFARIKEAHDALIKEAENAPKESTMAQAAAARSAATTATAAFQKTDDDDTINNEITEAIQKLDEAVLQSGKKSFFAKRKESAEIKKHRKKLKTNERRLRGKY